MNPFIRLHPSDDVLIARSQLVGGTTAESVVVKGLIPAGHKVAVRHIALGEPVRRYNQIIGFASKPIAAGEHVHTQNLWMGEAKGDFARDYAIGADVKPEVPRRKASLARSHCVAGDFSDATASHFSASGNSPAS